jgi:PBSX family phage terminase large subunit
VRVKLHKFQEKAFLSEKQIVINAAGIQSGKTICGALWIHLKAMSCTETDNLIIAAPTYKILSQASLPHFLKFARPHGTFHKVDSVFKYRHGATVYIRSLSDPNAMEGVTNVEGVWLDEGGLISRYAWENCLGRAAFRQAKVMVTTTPYSLNWLYSLWKEWKAGKRDDVDFFQFSSVDNPYFPKSEFERQKKILDPIRFAMKYQGVFGKMEGLVYPDVFFCKAIPMPPGTRYFAGVDWGYTNPFALVVRAVTPEGLHYRVDEYLKTQMDIDDCVHAARVKAGLYPIELFVCDPSAPMNIMKFNKAGLKAVKANNDIIHGIDVHRTLMKENRFSVFEDENPHGTSEYASYRYPEKKDLGLNDDEKEMVPVAQDDHSCDADRYISVYLESALADKRPITTHNPDLIPQDALKRLQWLKKGGSSRAKNY